MFGRKRKKKDDAVGLAGLSNATTSVTVTAVDPPAGTAPTPSPPPSTAGAPSQGSPAGQPAAFDLAALQAAGLQSSTAMLSQILKGEGPLGEMIAQIKADPQGFRERIMAQAQAAGASTFVMTPQGMTPLGGQGQHVDVIDELTRAADLHDKGQLTDAEFETLKKRLLAE